MVQQVLISNKGNNMTSSFHPGSKIATVARLALCASCALLSACVSTTPQWDQTFGDAVRTAVAQQTINPNASLNPDPVNGIDGASARESMGRYRSSFKEAQPAVNSFTIGVGK